MTYKEAMNYLMAYASCNFETKQNHLCEKCVWRNSWNCEHMAFNEENTVEVLNVINVSKVLKGVTE
jgi:hypothetical protein